MKTLVSYFLKSIKSSSHKYLGLEAEHFILRKADDSAVSYYGKGGVREIVLALMDKYPDAEAITGEDILGFTTPAFSITLEPAAQLEISIVPAENIGCIEKVYRGFAANLKEILEPMSLYAAAFGTQPASRVRDLPLIPKERYRLMDRYFAGTGTGGIEMMRGTASAQVSVDYFSEEDFRRKLQAAYYYTPVFKLLTDNSPVFEGVPCAMRLKRTDIWDRTDPARCGIIPGVFREDYSFEDYADFLEDMPLIFKEEGGQCIYTENVPVRDIFKGAEPSKEEILHILSMAFPDVRLKNFLEIRAADSVPEKYLFAYCALIKGLIYSEEGLSYAQERIRENDLTGEDIKSTQESLMKNGWQGLIYGRNAEETVREILDLAEKGLDAGETGYLGAFYEVIKSKGIQNT